MNNRLRLYLLVLLLIGSAQSLGAEKLPPLWGYGIKTCADYLAAEQARTERNDVAEYRRYEDWLTGFLSGLNLATGKDVLHGADVDAALRRIRAHCVGHEQQDFFNATMDLVKMLSKLR